MKNSNIAGTLQILQDARDRAGSPEAIKKATEDMDRYFFSKAKKDQGMGKKKKRKIKKEEDLWWD